MRLIKAPAALRGRKGEWLVTRRGGGREGRKTLSLPECQAARHVFFAVDRGDGDDENDKLFKAAAAPVAD